MSGRRDPAMAFYRSAAGCRRRAGDRHGSSAAVAAQRRLEEGSVAGRLLSPTVELESAGGVQGSQAARLAAASARPAIAIQRLTLPHWEAGCSSSARKRRARRAACPTSGALHPSPDEQAGGLSGAAVARRRRTLDGAFSSTCLEPDRCRWGIGNGLHRRSTFGAADAPCAGIVDAGAKARQSRSSLRGDPDTGPSCGTSTDGADRGAASDMVGDASMGFDEIQALALTFGDDQPPHSRAGKPRRRYRRRPLICGHRGGELRSIPTFGSMDRGVVAVRHAAARHRRGRRRASRPLRLDPRPARQRRCNMYPMLVGLWPLLGDGTLGSS